MISIPITPATAQPARTLIGNLRRLLQRLVADPAPLERTIAGTLAQRSLVAAANTGILDALIEHPGSDGQELARLCHCSPEGVDILVRALAGTGLLSRQGTGWRVRQAYTPLLRKDSFLRSWLDYSDSVIAPALLSLEDSVRHGTPEGLTRLYGHDRQNFYAAVATDPVNGPIFSKFMRAYSSINRDAVARHSVFAGPLKILDLGGGDGDLAMAIVTHHPDAEVTVADLPAVIERTSESFSHHPQASRLQTVAVDLLKDPLPRGYDIILCAHVIDILSPEEIRGLLTKAREALVAKGKLVVFTPVTSDHGRGPLINSLMGIYFLALARGKGRFYSTRKLREIAAFCGFKAFRNVPLPCDEVILIGEKVD
ncbi:methyltransferase [Cyanobium gracile]|uniref:Methylase involved in ubiquinone/menaquinone biosynthesis n=1 Tax=Cyanobium gracile (strain ATCC 27147 / PCC 6307) TaxID=292564 RepID=K9PCT1_CYAGP|nr:methyltransferase [Cyanobium gracile]AFY30349.1 methylase involved in ubiquinone/menaquinone biosynthesis [Cyanobium gracile PCC 6307]